MLYGIDPRRGRVPDPASSRSRAGAAFALRGGPRRVTPGRGGPPAAGKTETSGLPARATADAIERTRRTGTRTAAHARSARAGARHRRPPGAPDGPAAGFARRPAIGARERYPADYSRVPTDKSRRTRNARGRPRAGALRCGCALLTTPAGCHTETVPRHTERVVRLLCHRPPLLTYLHRKRHVHRHGLG